MQLHYVRGCSLAEAFYQSVSGPYQLLIVGDPLCQPWATIPKITVAGVKPEEKVKGSISLTPSGPTAVGTFELYVDGRLTARTVPGKPLPLDTTQLPTATTNYASSASAPTRSKHKVEPSFQSSLTTTTPPSK